MSVPAIQLQSNPSLAGLLRGFADAADIPVNGISSDSRQLKSGYLFLACAGFNSHGLGYLHEAKDAGVVAIAWDSSTSTPPDDIGIPMIAVENLAAHLGEIENPSIGVMAFVLPK